jgi:hypothetical protein
MSNLNCLDIEIAIANHFDVRRNLIIPNVSWGMHLHECDLLIMTQSRYLYEVEIKISKADLKKDLNKRHGHNSDKIKRLYFAIPEKLKDCIDLIPERAGIILVPEYENYCRCKVVREAQNNPKANPLTNEEVLNLSRLGVIRIFSLKKKIKNLKRSITNGQTKHN